MDGNGEQDEPAAKPKLRPANENPWYLLATLYGEQEIGEPWEFDVPLHERNKLAWNRYVVRGLSPETRECLGRLRDKDGVSLFTEHELTPFDETELEARRDTFVHNRGGLSLPVGKINFDETVFPKAFIARGFIFPHSMTFEGATFPRAVNFDRAALLTAAEFQHACFSSEARFEHTVFFHTVNFKASEFEIAPSFAYATFKKHPPAIHNAEIPEDAQWHGATWPEIPSDSEEAQEHLYNYERLKQEMERLKKQEDEQFFFVKELQCREVVDGFPKNLISKAYGYVSFYGRSILRPLCGLGFAWLAGLLLLWPLGRTGFRGLKFTEAFGLSFYNLFPFLPYRKEIYTQGFLDELSRLAHIVAAWQAFAGAALLFLIGLALRNRFRMK